MNDLPSDAQSGTAPADQPIRRALISVADKTDVIAFGRYLADRGVEILSTGGSARALADAGVAVTEVSSHTGFPEIMEGRVKTLHPKIHGGLLARRDRSEHLDAMTDYSIAPIDLLVGNLYPFEDTMAGGADWDTCIENIDIGGVAMLRAAAKNHAFVTVVVDPADYPAVMSDMTAHGGATTLALRRRLAATAFSRVAAYDSVIAGWLTAETGETYPAQMSIAGRRATTLRYGENPHQDAAVYQNTDTGPSIVRARAVQGRPLSYNNIADADAALALVSEFQAPAAAIIKHANPSGAAIGTNALEAYLKALACDPVSAFGGIVAINTTLTAPLAQALTEHFYEVVVAPDADDDALKALAAKPNLRVLLTGGIPDPGRRETTLRTIGGGFLVQSADNRKIRQDELEVVTKRSPTDQEFSDLLFSFAVVKHVRSNAIVFAKAGSTVGIGAGQMSRVDSVRIAVEKAGEIGRTEGEGSSRTAGSVVASDAFFPVRRTASRRRSMPAPPAVIQPGRFGARP